jgi:two-component system sensor histidine kinase KdpD
MNIFLNAAQINKSGTVIGVSLRVRGRQAVVKISNTGRPLPAVANIFVKGRSMRKDGSGLGLNICRQIVEAHKGKISARNTREGPVFTIELPTPSICTFCRPDAGCKGVRNFD